MFQAVISRHLWFTFAAPQEPSGFVTQCNRQNAVSAGGTASLPAVSRLLCDSMAKPTKQDRHLDLDRSRLTLQSCHTAIESCCYLLPCDTTTITAVYYDCYGSLSFLLCSLLLLVFFLLLLLLLLLVFLVLLIVTIIMIMIVMTMIMIATPTTIDKISFSKPRPGQDLKRSANLAFAANRWARWRSGRKQVRGS